MNLTIEKPQTGQLPKVKDASINDRDLLNDILSYQKYLSNGYNTSLNEAQQPQLHQAIQDILIDVHQTQYELFDLMFEKGWYKMKAAEAQEIQQASQQFMNYKSQFPQFSNS